VSDEFVDELLVNYALNFGQSKVKDDERLADGSVNANQRLIRNVVTPSQVGGTIRKQMDDYERIGKLQNTAQTKAGIRAVKTGGRIEVGFDLNVIDWLDQTTFRVAEISSG
jgi:hypothetical protein